MVATHQVSLRWRELFRPGNINEETFQKAEKLLETLRPEDPLRHRLYQEMQEIRRLYLQKKVLRKKK